ncbi:MAG TPA: MFS transporter [Stellaceae bacterium]|jgi:ACS family tartrate transporter-like MFS transporter|nr:MFS transporter [Stellaceae bacterium]
MEVSVVEEIERITIRAVAWRLLPLVFGLYLVSLIDRINLGFAALTMNKDLGLTPYTYSLGVAAFFLAYIPCEIPSNLILDRIGARRWIGRIAITWGLAASAMALVSGERSFVFVRFLLGLTEAGLFPGLLLYLTYWFPTAYRTRVNAAMVLAIPASGAIGGPLATSLMQLDGLLGLAGWKWMFLIEGLPSIVLGVVALRYLTERPATADWLPAAQRTWLQATLQREQAAVEAVHSRLSVWRALIDPRVLLLCTIYFAFGSTAYSIGYFLPLIVKGWGLSNFLVGWTIAIPEGVGIVAMMIGSYCADRFSDRRWSLAGLMVLCTIGFCGMGYFPVTMWAVIFVALVEVGSGVARPMFWTVPPTFLSRSAMAGAFGLITSFGNFGGIIGPIVIGWLKTTTGSFSGGLYYIAVVTLIAAIIFAAVPMSRQRVA